jgi:chromosomal replication initiator protein
MNTRSILPRDESNIAPELILRAVSEIWNTDLQQLLGAERKQPISFARQLCMALMYQMTHMTLIDVGQYFNNRHHSTVLYAINKVDQASSNAQIAKLINQSIQKIQRHENK